MDIREYYVFRNIYDDMSSEEFCALCVENISAAFNLLTCDAIAFLCQHGYIGDYYRDEDGRFHGDKRFIDFDSAGEMLLKYIKSLEVEDFKKHPEFTMYSDESIENIQECAAVVLKKGIKSREEVSIIAAQFAKHSNSAQVRKQLEAPQMGETEFVHPLTGEETRTTRSVPRKGFTSVSRIAKG